MEAWRLFRPWRGLRLLVDLIGKTFHWGVILCGAVWFMTSHSAGDDRIFYWSVILLEADWFLTSHSTGEDRIFYWSVILFGSVWLVAHHR